MENVEDFEMLAVVDYVRTPQRARAFDMEERGCGRREQLGVVPDAHLKSVRVLSGYLFFFSSTCVERRDFRHKWPWHARSVSLP